MGDLIDFKKKKRSQADVLAEKLEKAIAGLVRSYMKSGARPRDILKILARQTGLLLGRFIMKENWFPIVVKIVKSRGGISGKTRQK